MMRQCGGLQLQRLTPECSSKGIAGRYSKCTGAGARGVIDSVVQQQTVLFKSIRVCDDKVGDVWAHCLSRRPPFGSSGFFMSHCSRDFGISKTGVSCSLTSVPTPYSPEADVQSRNAHFERVEQFYDDNGFLFNEENWDMDAEEASSFFKDYLGTLITTAGQVEDGSTVLSWGGSSALIRQLSDICPGSLVVSHCSLSLLAVMKESNDDILCWHGDIVDMPTSSYGPFDSVFLNSMPALSVSPVELLQAVAGLCRFGARIVISNSQGRKGLATHREKNPGIVLHDLPDLAGLERMIAGLPLKIVEFQDDSLFFLAALEMTEQASLSPGMNVIADSSVTSTLEIRSNGMFKLVPNYPLRVTGHVVKGFGRGSKQLGIPTANVDPQEVPEVVYRLPKGVYCGWAQVHGEGLDDGVHKMVMNVGNRPTFADGAGISVEVHILYDYGNVDFYGERLSLVVLGFIREEMQFKSLGELVQRIHTDIEIARMGLEQEDIKQFAADEVFLGR